MKKTKDKSTFKRLAQTAKPYLPLLLVLFLINVAANGLGLLIPKTTAYIIDNITSERATFLSLINNLAIISVAIFGFSVLQSLLQTYISEKVGRDLRKKLIEKISEQPFSFMAKTKPEKILTNLTSDIDNIKQTISLGMVQVFTSLILILGASSMLISINARLATIVLVLIPVMIFIFVSLFSQIRNLFTVNQKIIDRLNKTINESIVASSLIRILNSQAVELNKFNIVAEEAREVGLSILKLFSSLIPLIGLIANITIVVILYLGGRLIISDQFTIGGFTAFLSYVSMLIFPIIVMGFISNVIAQGVSSFDRISTILYALHDPHLGEIDKKLEGKVEFKNVNLSFENKEILKKISFTISSGSKTAILGPTAAGKTQIFYLLAGLIKKDSGQILIDDTKIEDYTASCLANQIGLVFQDSSIFNTSIRENINFKNVDNQEAFIKAVETAELNSFIETLPNGLDTKVSERGASLSGGQKQRITLARALVINPKILLLDDFTARVDKQTENKIKANLKTNYSGITQILITQQISSVEDFDQIILIMEGEVLAIGTHKELLEKSSEYQQIYNSQKSVS